jgi:NAD(P)H-flavin reductase
MIRSCGPGNLRAVVNVPTKGEMQSFSARLTAFRDLTYDVRQIALALLDPPEMRFIAGQFVSFEIARPGSDITATRPYSIASSPTDLTSVQLLFNRVSGGPGSGYLFSLQPGDVTAFKGPVGSFTLRDSARDILFVATGTGIAPIRSMLRALTEAGSTRRITLLWGLRSERDLYYQDELTDLRDRLPQFSFTTTLSQPGANWSGAAGRVVPLVVSEIDTVANLDVYLCGNGSMIREVRDVIRRMGVCPIYTEQYYSGD